MFTFMSKELRDALDAARKAKSRRKTRIRVVIEGDRYPALRLWKDGFAVDSGLVPPLRGYVDLYDGTQHLYRCLIVASELQGDEVCYEYKLSTPAEVQPPLDYYRAPDAPVALLER